MDVRLWSRTDDCRRIRRPLGTFMSLAFPHRLSPDCPTFWVNFTVFSFFFFLFFTFSSPCFRFLIRKITCVSVTSAGLSYSVFTGISCLEIHYLSKKVGTVSIRYRKIHFNFNPTCSLTIYNMSGDFGDCMQTECVWLVYCVSNVSVNAT